MKIGLLILLVVLSGIPALVYSSEEEKLGYPSVGILSSNTRDSAMARYVLSDYTKVESIQNRESDFCKFYMSSVALGTLEEILVFSTEDIVVDKELVSAYGPESDLFETCNYLESFPHLLKPLGLFLEGKWPEDVALDWHRTDAYVEGEHTLLLLQFPEGFSLMGNDDLMIKALIIDKSRQKASNKMYGGSEITKAIFG